MRVFFKRKPSYEARPRPWERSLGPPDAFLSAELRQLSTVYVNFNSTWELLGLRFTEEHGRLTLGLHWRCLQPCAGWLRCFGHLLDRLANQVACFDHDLLDGDPPVAEWQPGDEGYEIRYLELDPEALRKSRLTLEPNGYRIRPTIAAEPTLRLRLGLFDTIVSTRLPLVASSLPVVDHFTAACVEANQVPGAEPTFQFEPSVIQPCRVVFGDGVELEGYSITVAEGVMWVRLRWNVRKVPPAPVRFFGHAVAVRDPSAEILVSFDDEMAFGRRSGPAKFEQNIVRSLPATGPAPSFLRGGVCTSQALERFEIRENNLDCDLGERSLYLSIPAPVPSRRPKARSSEPRILEAECYTQSYASRLQNLFQHVDPGGLAGKRVLELGCGTGQLGQELAKLGCRVVSVDANPDYIRALRERFPEREAFVMDLELDDAGGALSEFDMVLCFGLLYRVSKPTALLKACCRLAPEIYLETVVCDSDEVNYQVVVEGGPDQAVSHFGCRPTPAWITTVMQSHGFDVCDISSATANWGGSAPSVFDWTARNDGSWQREGRFLRKMFVCRRKDQTSTSTRVACRG
jgi:hypothetical protein